MNKIKITEDNFYNHELLAQYECYNIAYNIIVNATNVTDIELENINNMNIIINGKTDCIDISCGDNCNIIAAPYLSNMKINCEKNCKIQCGSHNIINCGNNCNIICWNDNNIKIPSNGMIKCENDNNIECENENVIECNDRNTIDGFNRNLVKGHNFNNIKIVNNSEITVKDQNEIRGRGKNTIYTEENCFIEMDYGNNTISAKNSKIILNEGDNILIVDNCRLEYSTENKCQIIKK